MRTLRLAAFCAAFLLALAAAQARPLDAQIYDGLLVPEMGTITNAMTARGQNVERLWHDQEDPKACPPYLVGHSMGGNAALRQARRCAAAGRPPRAVVTIDPGRAPLYHACPAGVRCYNLYNPSHPIGGEYVAGANNIVISGVTHLQMPSSLIVVKMTLGITANGHAKNQRRIDDGTALPRAPSR